MVKRSYNILVAAVRTITVIHKEALGTPDCLPESWIVRLEGYEFTHGNVHAMLFSLREDAIQFALDLKSEYGKDTSIDIVGLDDLGLEFTSLEELYLPETDDEWQAEIQALCPHLTTGREKTLQLVAKALFLDGTAEYRLNLILGLWRHDLLPSHVKELRSLDAPFVLARLKIILPSSFIVYAELESEFRLWCNELKDRCNMQP